MYRYTKSLMLYSMLVSLLPGCAAAQLAADPFKRVYYFAECVSENMGAKAAAKDTYLEAQRYKHQLSRESQRRDLQLEREALMTEALDERESQEKAFDDSVRTKLGLNVDYDMEIGKPTLDVAHMKDAITKYERDLQLHQAQTKIIREKNDSTKKKNIEAQLRAQLDGKKPESQLRAGCVPSTCALPNEPQLKQEPQIDEPTPPTLDVLKLTIPVSLKLGGSGKVEDTVTRRTPKPEPQVEGQEKCQHACCPSKPDCVAPCPPDCATP